MCYLHIPAKDLTNCSGSPKQDSLKDKDGLPMGHVERRSCECVQILKVPCQITQAEKQISIGPQTSRRQKNRQSPQRNQAGAENVTCHTSWGSQNSHLVGGQV